MAEVKLKTTGGNVGIATVIHEIYSHYREPLRVGDKLYTTPPAAQRQPLTEEQIDELVRKNFGFITAWQGPFVRAIEAAHGIQAPRRNYNHEAKDCAEAIRARGQA